MHNCMLIVLNAASRTPRLFYRWNKVFELFREDRWELPLKTQVWQTKSMRCDSCTHTFDISSWHSIELTKQVCANHNITAATEYWKMSSHLQILHYHWIIIKKKPLDLQKKSLFIFWREQIEVGHMGENKNLVRGRFINLYDIIKGWPFKGDGKQNMVRPFSVLYNICEFCRTWDLQNPYWWRNTVRRVSQVEVWSEASRAENSSWICKRWVFIKTSSQSVLAPSNVLHCEFPVICTVENVEAVSHDSFPCHP